MTAAIDILAEANRVARRESLLEFVIDANPGYLAGWVHKEVCEALEQFMADVQAGKKPRLAIFMPPRSGKSEIATRCFPAWGVGHDPTLEFMVVSYSSDLANSFSYDCRDIVRRDWYADTFPDASMETDRKGITRWRLTAGGGYNPIGIGGSITGSGADILILDDLFKSEQQANSAAHRDMVHDRYRSSIYNRLSPRGGIIMLMTRWHDDDLPGRLLAADEEAGRWKVITYPALAERDERHRKKGEALHPERFDRAHWLDIKATSTPSEWASLYQQNPIPEGGGKFDVSRLRRFDLDAMLNDPEVVFDALAISIDSAFKKAVRSDRCAFQVWGVRTIRDDFPVYQMQGAEYVQTGTELQTLSCFYLLHAFAEKLDFDGLCLKAAEMARAWTTNSVRADKVRLVIEDQGNGVALIRDLERQEGVTHVFRFSPQKLGGKDERANMAGLQVTGGRVFVPHEDDRRRPWVRTTTDELRRFPSGKYDDAVDAMSQAIIYLSGAVRQGAAGGFRAGKPARRGWARHA